MPRRRTAGKGKATQQAVSQQTLNQLSPSRPPEGGRDPNLMAFKKVIAPKVKPGGDLEEQAGRERLQSLRDWGRRERQKLTCTTDPLEASKSQLSMVVGDI